MRKLAAAALAVPVLVLVYASFALRRAPLLRLAVVVGVVAIVALGAFGALRPSATTARPPGEIAALPVAAFTTPLQVDREPDAATMVAFTSPMDPLSVEAALRVQPPVPVELSWNAERTILSVRPRASWIPGALHTVTVDAGTLDANGTPLMAPARASFLVRPATAAAIAVTGRAGKRVSVDTSFVVTFERPVDLATATTAFRITPEVAGTFALADRRAAGTSITFTPDAPLAPDTIYTVTLAGDVLDAAGAPLGEPPSLAVRTAKAPAVVRFRPLNSTTDVARAADVSVRFTQAMDRRSTAKAFSVTVGGKAVTGKVRWAEGDTVLVFDPEADFGYEQKVVVAVSAAATSRAGAAIAAPTSATFTTEEKPAPARRPTTTPPPTRPAPSTGGSTGSATWGAVERYYLKLMNCTRTGGWVTSSGGCSSPGGRDVAPLALSSGISSSVARPYAKLLATRNMCSHFIGGNPGDRLRRAGYTSYRWAENLGCRSGNAYDAVLGSHLFFQSEKPYNGGHYRNLMDARYDRVGIGVWVSSGRVRLVVDFYHP